MTPIPKCYIFKTISNTVNNFSKTVFYSKIFGIICTLVAEHLLTAVDDDRVANGMLAGVLLIGVFITAVIKPVWTPNHIFNII